MSINSVVIVQDRQCRGKSHFQDPCRVRLHQNGSHRFQKAEISQVFISNAVLRNNFRDIYKTKGTIFSHFVLLLQYISNINFEPPWLKTDQLFSKRTWGFSTHFFFKYGLILNGSQYFIIWIKTFSLKEHNFVYVCICVTKTSVENFFIKIRILRQK